MLTTKLYKEHLTDVATVNGIKSSSKEASLRHLLWSNKSQNSTVAFVKDYHPDYCYVLDKLKQSQETDESTTTGKKKATGQLPTTWRSLSSTSRGSDYYSQKVTGTTTG